MGSTNEVVDYTRQPEAWDFLLTRVWLMGCVVWSHTSLDSEMPPSANIIRYDRPDGVHVIVDMNVDEASE